ncbi:TetR/AcrR family transcriptional regulator [Aliagarivorans taiwanensis]|uniref:TetR/AcrR family transcriptional regulator n=1 Tax=Aliagarivorans taiwanensis TaxID=561966 RepID=UPI00047E44D6|nr:TetR/AcrR family transcriptional regulator [Aliagarivorans taiwanensis]
MQTSTIRRRTRLSPEVRRKQLMECAIEVFARRGIGRAGHAEIAELATVSVATVFNYFNTREDLVDAVLSEVEQTMQQLVEAAYAENDSAMQAVQNHLSALLDMTYDQPDVIRIWLEWSSSVREDVWPRFSDISGKINKQIGDVLQQGFDKGEISSSLNALQAAQAINGAIYLGVQMSNRPDKPAKQEVLDFLGDYVQSLLRPPAH